jgi:uncharacterized protein DUF4328
VRPTGHHRPRWVATVPRGVRTRSRAAPAGERPYSGPPAYSSVPRWGFPALAWRWPTTVPGAAKAEPFTVDRVRLIARNAAAMLGAFAVLAVLTAGAEVWRYVLLLQSRSGALMFDTVTLSDTLVMVGAVLAIAMGLLAVIMTLWWLYLARGAAAQLSEQRPARPAWEVLVYLLIPGLNLLLAGSVLAELEHAVLRRSADERPRPSRATLVWWAAWVLGGVLFFLTIAWRFRDGAQAMADGVVLSAACDLTAAAVAILTAFTIRRLTALMAPIDPESVRFLRVIRVENAPTPPLRTTPHPASRR